MRYRMYRKIWQGPKAVETELQPTPNHSCTPKPQEACSGLKIRSYSS